MLGDSDLDRWDVEHLPDRAADLGSIGQTRAAAAATRGFVADHHIWIRHLREAFPLMAVLPARFAFRLPT